MTAKTNIILLGFMGTGKSAVGRRVAERLGKSFVDMDAVIEERAGKNISRIFAEDGEPAFRALERALVVELAGEENRVVAAGGGVVLNRHNLDDFEQSGVLICLMAAPETILKRVELETHRPLLEDGDKAQRILDILEHRRPLYESIQHGIDTTDLPVEAVVDRVAEVFEEVTRDQ